jgi:hypothetical protein
MIKVQRTKIGTPLVSDTVNISPKLVCTLPHGLCLLCPCRVLCHAQPLATAPTASVAASIPSPVLDDERPVDVGAS